MTSLGDRCVPALSRVLIGLHPRWFRREYAADIRDAIAAELNATKSNQTTRGVLADLARNLGRVWMSTLQTGGSEREPVRGAGALATGGGGFRGLGHDVRGAVRGIVRRPATSAGAVLTLAVGIGLTAAMFSIVQGLAMRPLQVDEPERVVAVRRLDPRFGESGVVPIDFSAYDDLRTRQTSFAALAGWQGLSVNLADDLEPADAIGGLAVTTEFFDAIGLQPILGRAFAERDGAVGAEAVVVIAHDLWSGRFGADPDILGTSIRLDGTPTRVVGVMPEGFGFPWNSDVWKPLQLDRAELARGEGPRLFMVGRLASEVSETAAAAELTGLVGQFAEEHPDTDGGYERVLVREWTRDFLGSSGRQALFAMLLAVSMVLVLACANVANLLLVRAVQSTRELAVRAALGAGRHRLVRQALIDALVIAGLGALGGLGIAAAGSRWFTHTMESLSFGIPFYVDVSLDFGVGAFVVALAAISAVLSAVLPVLHVGRTDSHDVLRSGCRLGPSRTAGRAGRVLVVVQVAVAYSLLLGAAAFGGTLGELRSIALSFDPDEIFTGAITLPERDYAEPEARRQFYRALVERLESGAGLRAVSLASDLPVAGFGASTFGLAGEVYEARQAPRARLSAVSPSFLDVLDLVPLQGRSLSAADDETSPRVAVVTASFAQRYLESDPVGARIVLGPRSGETAAPEDEIEVVGVIPDIYADVPTPPLPREAVVVPLAQRPEAAVNVIARAGAEPLAAAAGVRDALTGLDPDLPLSAPMTLRDMLLQNNFFLEILGTLFGVFGAAALLLSAVGVYGVMAFSTGIRKHEGGVRIALGATRRQVSALMVRQGLWRVAFGVAAGFGIGFLLVSSLSAALRVGMPTAATFAVLAALLLGTGALGSWLPARRAAALDLVDTLSMD
ncbi:MAG: FtsX-like permease family protein [Acidobacteria bacterium]|nr:FtsX-like permease family protein [Acidobacteriota bacterium]